MAAKHKPKWKQGIRCHHCGKLRHMQKDCYNHEKPKNADRKKSSVSAKKSNDTSTGFLASAQALAAGNHTNSWIIDSGDTCHICCNKMMFSELEVMNRPQVVTLGEGRSIEYTKRGTVKLKLKQLDGTYKSATLHDVLYVPELLYNLLSISKATDFGKRVKFDDSMCKIINEDQGAVGSAMKCGSLYYLNCQKFNQRQMINAAKEQSNIAIWHHRYGHLNVASLKKLANEQLVNDLNHDDVSNEMRFCESCTGEDSSYPIPNCWRKMSISTIGTCSQRCLWKN